MFYFHLDEFLKKGIARDFNKICKYDYMGYEGYKRLYKRKKKEKKMWNKIVTESDISNFMRDMNCFSDSCIKEIKYVSGGYVNKDLSMYALNSKRNLYICIQRQYNTFSTIELIFQGVYKFSMTPRNEHKDCVIYDSSLIKKQNLYYWADYEDLDINNIDDYGTLVIAEQMYWRNINTSLGNKEVYISNLE